MIKKRWKIDRDFVEISYYRTKCLLCRHSRAHAGCEATTSYPRGVHYAAEHSEGALPHPPEGLYNRKFSEFPII
jgi:hypothetical protein